MDYEIQLDIDDIISSCSRKEKKDIIRHAGQSHRPLEGGLRPMVSIVEQHVDGSWWYHPGETWATREEAEAHYHDFWGIQEYPTCTFNFEVFHFGGFIRWPRSREGELIRL